MWLVGAEPLLGGARPIDVLVAEGEAARGLHHKVKSRCLPTRWLSQLHWRKAVSGFARDPTAQSTSPRCQNSTGQHASDTKLKYSKILAKILPDRRSRYVTIQWD